MFDQGLAQAFGFHHEAAIRSFERAAELDPSAADAALGQGVGARPELQPRHRRRARESGVRRASRKRSRSPPPAPSTRRHTSRRSASRYSADPESRPGGARARVQPGDGRSVAPLSGRSRCRGDLRRKPDEPDAVEAVDARRHARRRTPSTSSPCSSRCCCAIRITWARIITTFTPSRPRARRRARCRARSAWRTLAESSGHLLHMPAHIYARTGDHAAAAAANAAGAAADRRYLVTAPPNGMYGMMYYPHNLHFLADSHMMQGRFADAKQAADRVAEQLNPHAAMMPMVESMVVMPVSVLLRFSKARRCAGAAGAAGRSPRAARVASLRARHRTRQNRQGRRSRGREKSADHGDCGCA